MCFLKVFWNVISNKTSVHFGPIKISILGGFSSFFFFSLSSSKDNGVLLEEDINSIVISIDCPLWQGVR